MEGTIWVANHELAAAITRASLLRSALETPSGQEAVSGFDNLGDYYAYLKNHNLVSLKGERVKSYEEAEIANFLCLNGIEYTYEPKYKFDVADRTHRTV